jgi:hypothetical protein
VPPTPGARAIDTSVTRPSLSFVNVLIEPFGSVALTRLLRGLQTRLMCVPSGEVFCESRPPPS